jgi:hypothetical protein
MKITTSIFFLAVAVLSFSSCSSNAEDTQEAEITIDDLIQSAKEIDDSLYQLTEQLITGQIDKIDRLVYHEGAQRYLKIFELFPNDPFAPEALEKAAGLYLGIHIEELSAQWRDTILVNYPDYSGRSRILELQLSYYDNFEVFNPEKAHYYLELLLKQKDLDAQKRGDFELRMKHMDKSLLEFQAEFMNDTEVIVEKI